MSTPRASPKRSSASRSRTSASPAKTSSSPPRSTAASAPAATTSAPRAATSWTPSKPASSRLQTDHIDLYQIHGNDAVTPVEETLRALDTLVQQGKVRYIGVSNWQAWKIAKALGISELKNLARFDTLQAYYSIAGRDLEREIVPLLEAEKTGLLVWSPLAGGLLSGKFTRENQKPEDSRRSEFDFPLVDKERTWNILDVMRPIAEAHNCSAARVALAWLLAKPVVTSVIIGAKRLDQLHDNLAAADLKLTADEIKQLDEVSALPPEYPGWMLPFQGANRLANVPRPGPERSSLSKSGGRGIPRVLRSRLSSQHRPNCDAQNPDPPPANASTTPLFTPSTSPPLPLSLALTSPPAVTPSPGQNGSRQIQLLLEARSPPTSALVAKAATATCGLRRQRNVRLR